MAPNGLFYADVPLRNYSLTHSLFSRKFLVENTRAFSSGVFRIWQRGSKASARSASLYRGSGGGAPSGVQGQSPWSGGHGGEAPLKLKHFLLLNVQWTPQICAFF